jgi:long-chain acyl-CoA synthetase
LSAAKIGVIISSGYNVYPARIEDAIFAHHAVADVAVIGVNDDYRGESVKAVIVLKPGQAMTLEDLQQWLKPRLSTMEMPRNLELREALPKSPA